MKKGEGVCVCMAGQVVDHGSVLTEPEAWELGYCSPGWNASASAGKLIAYFNHILLHFPHSAPLCPPFCSSPPIPSSPSTSPLHTVLESDCLLCEIVVHSLLKLSVSHDNTHSLILPRYQVSAVYAIFSALSLKSYSLFLLKVVCDVFPYVFLVWYEYTWNQGEMQGFSTILFFVFAW